MFDDFVYFSTLGISITIGDYYKNIDNIEVKKHYGTGVGILIIFFNCGPYIYHTILLAWLNAVIFKYCEKRYVHIVSLSYTWTHLLYLHFSLHSSKYLIMIHQNIALRLVGVAFELYSADKNRLNAEKPLTMPSDDLILFAEITTADILSYAFCFIGLHNGPYFRYKQYIDNLKGTFGSLGNFRQITEYKLKKAVILMVIFLILRMTYSPQIYKTAAFYEYDAEKRYLYNVPILLMFVLQNIILMLLCTCVCTEAGFGLYPAKTMPRPGHGPTKRLSLVKMNEEEALQEEYNFSMIKCYDTEKLLLGPKMLDTVRSWNMSVRYWFYSNIYGNVNVARTEMRSACSYIAWAIWNGASLGSIITVSTLWVYLHIEEEYSNIYNTVGQMKVAWDIGFSIMRTFCLIYLTPCFILKDASTVLKYYHSIFWVFHGILVVLIVGAIVAHKSKMK